ncbi:MAG: DegT/DnrJ/EryC1/StrS family aminotransferase, partial [Parcubacteria group bacterium]
SWGFAGSYSFYATKTMPIGEGGMVVSYDNDFLKWIERYRNYGKQVIDGKVNYPVKNGFNYRMNEFSAALGIVQLEQLPEILKWKNELASKYDRIFQNRVIFPDNMVSGYYKYIVYDCELKEETGKVFARTDLGHVIDGLDISLPNAEWISTHHKCVPIYHGWDKAVLNADDLKACLF